MTKWKGIIGRAFTPALFRQHVQGLTFVWRPEFIVIHNTQIPKLSEWRYEKSIASLERYYRDEQKWSAGPHLFIDDKNIWAFTPLTTPGVHSPSWNSRAWGIEIVGDFDTEPFGDAQKRLVFEALLRLHQAMGWTEPKLRLHKEDPGTTHKGCPGKNVVKAELQIGLDTLLLLNAAA